MTMPTDCEKRSLLVALAGALSLLALPWRGANGAGAELIAQPEMRDDAAFIGRALTCVSVRSRAATRDMARSWSATGLSWASPRVMWCCIGIQRHMPKWKQSGTPRAG